MRRWLGFLLLLLAVPVLANVPELKAYNANGNLLVRGSQRPDYNAENRLASVTTGSSSVGFGYSADGARLWKQSGTNLQVWIGNNYEEKEGKVLFHILAGGIVCTFDATGTNIFEYYQPDHLRSTSNCEIKVRV